MMISAETSNLRLAKSPRCRRLLCFALVAAVFFALPVPQPTSLRAGPLLAELINDNKSSKILKNFKGIADIILILEEARSIAADRERQERVLALQVYKEVKAETEAIEQKLKRMEWALDQFESVERGKETRPKNVTSLMAHWERSRRLFRHQYLTSLKANAGAIRSGRALNFFLEACGPTALKHAWYRQRAAELRATPTHTLNSEEQKRLASLRSRKEEILNKSAMSDQILQNLGRRLWLGPAETKLISTQRGLLGAKLTLTLGEQTDPLPLNWPAILKLEEDYAPWLSAIEQNKATALNELREGRGVSSSTLGRLMHNVQGLRWLLNEEYRGRMSRIRSGEIARGITEYYPAFRMLKRLSEGVLHVAEARTLSDLGVAEPFSSGTVEDLIAYMRRHGLRFSVATRNGEHVHELVFYMLRDYYMDLHMLRLAELKTKNQLKRSTDYEKKLMDRIVGNTKNGLTDYLSGKDYLAIAGMHVLGVVLEGASDRILDALLREKD